MLVKAKLIDHFITREQVFKNLTQYISKQFSFKVEIHKNGNH